MNRFSKYLIAICLLSLSLPLAHAQGVDIALGFGSIQDKATATGLDTNTFLSCSPVDNFTCFKTSSLNSFVMGFGGQVMLTKNFGAGVDITFQPAKQTYAALDNVGDSLQTRLSLYDFKAVYQPISTKRVALQFSGGIGVANLKSYVNSTSSSLFGTSNSNTAFASDNHFQVHGGVGVPIYVTNSVFIRPQFTIHRVNNFAQYNSDVVTQEMVWIGYTFGGR